MAVRLFAHEVSDLCLGKPALRSISVADTVADALSVLKRLSEGYLSVWSCDHSFVKPNLRKTEQGGDKETGDCRCIGKVCMVDVICYLCKPENLASPATALQSPISVLIPKNNGLVKHLEPNARFVADLVGFFMCFPFLTYKNFIASFWNCDCVFFFN